MSDRTVFSTNFTLNLDHVREKPDGLQYLLDQVKDSIVELDERIIQGRTPEGKRVSFVPMTMTVELRVECDAEPAKGLYDEYEEA